ncbi:NUDIX domain-containing protein [Lacticaseibacillus kribbianus]|uniref:NUDIX domain-containing protein n=1 Tax=Lacticaseibacillus kribbianus TaxID=2926292 RepID=UPI001CD63316|nr:NUDIX domain-containing protein [Lacticaseibacillus kribbianus]
MQEERDLRYPLDAHHQFGVRAVLLLQHDDRVLLKHVTEGGESVFIAPGGAVKFGETGSEAAAREAKEELGLTLAPTLVGVVEAFIAMNGANYHQLLMVTTATLDAAQAARLAARDLTAFDLPQDTVLAWVPVEEAAARLRPQALGRYLFPAAPFHAVDRREVAGGGDPL